MPRGDAAAQAAADALAEAAATATAEKMVANQRSTLRDLSLQLPFLTKDNFFTYKLRLTEVEYHCDWPKAMIDIEQKHIFYVFAL